MSCQVGLNERSFLGVGFAIPSSIARRVIPALIKKGVYQHPYMGIGGDDVTLEIAQAMGLNIAYGVLIEEVRPNSPASRAGLRAGQEELILQTGERRYIGGDILTAIDDESIHTFGDLISFLGRRGTVGDTVVLTLIRDRETKTIALILGERPQHNQLFRP